MSMLSPQTGPSCLLYPWLLRHGQIYGTWVMFLTTFSILYKLLNVIYESEENILNVNNLQLWGRLNEGGCLNTVASEPRVIQFNVIPQTGV